MKKRILAILLAGVMAISVLTGCSAEESAGKVYYLNFKPEADAAWQDLAAQYTEETGVEVKVVTAASGEYEQTLTAEMGKDSAPTMFQAGTKQAVATWADYIYDLKDTDVYAEMSTDEYNITGDNGEVYSIAYCYESYGIIVNTALLKEAGYELADITNFETLKAVAEDITARKDELGFAAFSSAGMDSSSDWRFKTHLANLPIYFEYQADGISATDAIKGSFLDNYRGIWDLYINNSTCEPAELSAKTGDDSRAEFLAGEAVFFQNGSWEYGSLTAEGAFSDEDLVMIPIYVGAGDEANQGLCTGTENYWCVNSQADAADIQATLDFIAWCVSSEEGTTAMAEAMGFVIPFKNAAVSPNLFVKQDTEYTAAGKNPVSWNFTTMPSEEWKNGVGSALTAYAADQTEDNWNAVVKAFVDGWATEYSLNAAN